jgi:hypothetical protein
MYKLCIALAAFSLAAATTASAATIDVDNLLVGPTGTGVSGLGALSATVLPGPPGTNYAFQTWTVGQAGRLAQVDLFGSVGSAYSPDGGTYTGGPPFPFDVTLTILGGGTTFAPGDQVLGSVTKSADDVANFGVTTFDFSALDIYAAAGTLLTWRMSVDACPMRYCVQGWSNWNDFTAIGGGSTNGYAGGGAFLQSNGVLYNFGHLDLNFRTSMDVPEPATWGLMILGFAGVAGMLRRQRPRMA